MDFTHTEDKNRVPKSFENFTFDEAIQYIKAHPERFITSGTGREVLKLIKEAAALVEHDA